MGGCYRYTNIVIGNDGICCWLGKLYRSASRVIYYDFNKQKHTYKEIKEHVSGCAVIEKFGCLIVANRIGIINLDGVILSKHAVYADKLFSDGDDLCFSNYSGLYRIEIADPPSTLVKHYGPKHHKPHAYTGTPSGCVIESLTGDWGIEIGRCFDVRTGKTAELFLMPIDGKQLFPAIVIRRRDEDPIVIIDKDTKYNNGQTPIIFFLGGMLYYTGDHNQLKMIGNDRRIYDIYWKIRRDRARIICSVHERGVAIICNKWLYIMTPPWHRSRLKYLSEYSRQIAIAIFEALELIPKDICDMIIAILDLI